MVICLEVAMLVLVPGKTHRGQLDVVSREQPSCLQLCSGGEGERICHGSRAWFTMASASLKKPPVFNEEECDYEK